MENNYMNILKYGFIYNNQINLCEDSLIKNQYTWSKEFRHIIISSTELFCSLIKDNFNILDIGAQSGCFSLAAKFFPNTKWKSFEPDPTNYDLLLKNLQLNEIINVECFPFGISDINGELDFNVSLHHKGLNTFGFQNLQDLGEIQKIKAKVFKLDDIINEKVDLIKIDTEGCELNILKGGFGIINKYKPKIFLEFSNSHLQKFGNNSNELLEFLELLNYKIEFSYDDNILISPK
jgi:FkbM family methyltransferase